ncbi:MAG: GNAT family N-acetyltransferase, partial [Lewinella sp.]
YAIARDPLLWEQHRHSNRHQESVFRKFFADNLASGEALVVEDRQTNRPIGHTRLATVPGQPDAVEIGYTFLARSCWGGTYNAAVKQLLLDHAFAYVAHVVLYVAGDNQRSHRAVRKIGGIPITEANPLAALRKDDPDYTSYVITRPA